METEETEAFGTDDIQLYKAVFEANIQCLDAMLVAGVNVNLQEPPG